MKELEPPDESLLEFPLELSVKAIGRPDDNFKEMVTDIVRQHLPADQLYEVTTLPSSKGNYVSVRVKFVAQSREQLESVYQALKDSNKVLFAL